jgi:hypothetical protein
VAAVPAETDTLADFEDGHIGGEGVDDAGYFVAGDAGILDGEDTVFGDGVAVTNAAGLHADAHMAGAWFGEFALHQLEITAGCGYLKSSSGNTRHIGLLLSLGCPRRFLVSFRLRGVRMPG